MCNLTSLSLSSEKPILVGVTIESLKRSNALIPELVPADDGRGIDPFPAYHEDMGRKSDQRYPDVRYQMESDFTLAQHKEFLEQLRRGESIYVRVEA